MNKLLVAVDGSEPSIRAARFAAELAKGQSAQLTLVYVVAPFPIVPGDLPVGVDELNQSMEKFGQKVLREAQDALGGGTLKVDARLLHGHPATEIDALAKQEGYGLIAVGSRGGGGLARLLLGSVADRLVRTAETPVVVVH